MSNDDEAARAQRKAMDLLARREHTKKELSVKLADRGFSAEVAGQVLSDLADKGLISECRFAEAYVAARRRRGMGPVRLRAELRQRGVADEIIEQALSDTGIDWAETAVEVRRKKFGAGPPADFAERARQMRFLEYRGFGNDLIRVALDE